jgi:hypothetical protein
MINEHDASCCSCETACCDSEVPKRKIIIDFLYLDLSVCTRCQGTGGSLEEAVSEVAKVLEAANMEVLVNKVEIKDAETAIRHKFVSSPTIRINGQDIQLDVKESLCESCGTLCGTDVDCRVWVYQGKEYSVPPKALIIEAILRAIYGGSPNVPVPDEEYVLPQNLKKFFAAKEKK